MTGNRGEYWKRNGWWIIAALQVAVGFSLARAFLWAKP